MKKIKGFTLIELLVVIAIIGILSGALIVLWFGSTTKAKDARITDEISQIRNQAAIYYSDHGYSFTGFSCSNISVLCDDITNQGGLSLLINVNPTGQEYCVEVRLNSGAWWCIDARGRSALYDTSTTPPEPDCADGAVYTCE
jgi:prepilin-type N-terminal cleavage/methylation domain-containing protein